MSSLTPAITFPTNSDLRGLRFEAPSFRTVECLLRGSTDLGFHGLRTFAVNCLLEEWSDDLSKFSAEPKWADHALEIVSLAKEFNVPSVLQRAMYQVSTSYDFGLDKVRPILFAADRWLTLAAPSDCH